MDFEVFRPIAKRNTRYTLWYRMKLTNQSCHEIWGLELNDLMFSQEQSGSTRLTEGNALNFIVWGPDGAEVKQGTFAKSRDYEFLYRPSDRELKAWQAETERTGRLLLPGATFTSIPSQLAPLRQTTRIDWTTGRHSIGYEHIPPPPGAESPPPGFRVLDTYSFDKPGVYRIQALYSDRVTATAFRTGLENVPWLAALPTHFLLSFGVYVVPLKDAGESRYLDLQLKSDPFEFRVE